MPFVRSLAALAALAVLATPAVANLEQEPRITEGLIAVGMAHEIADVCPRLEGRTFRGLQYLLSLKSAAGRMGYSTQEINRFIDDDAAKDRLEAIARARLAAKGARRGDVEAHCRVGEAERAANSQIGLLLKVD
ncbi:MAG: DUF5333 domain-containing protein [Jannaschia sp.]